MVDFIQSKFDEMVEQFQSDKTLLAESENNLLDLRAEKKAIETNRENAEAAREIIQIVAQKTLSSLEFRVSNLVTIALASVDRTFPEFVARMVTRRNQTETDLLFKEYGTEQKPLKSSGHGACDVSAFALRPTFWSLNKTRPTFVLDEPFRNVSPDLQYKVSEMIKMISDKLGLQILMVSHAENINLAADKTFYTRKEGKYSIVEEEE